MNPSVQAYMQCVLRCFDLKVATTMGPELMDVYLCLSVQGFFVTKVASTQSMHASVRCQ